MTLWTQNKWKIFFTECCYTEFINSRRNSYWSVDWKMLNIFIIGLKAIIRAILCHFRQIANKDIRINKVITLSRQIPIVFVLKLYLSWNSLWEDILSCCIRCCDKELYLLSFYTLPEALTSNHDLQNDSCLTVFQLPSSGFSCIAF